MFKTPEIELKLFAILKADRWDLLPTFFGSWESEDEMIDKVILFGHFFLAHYFRNQSPPFHRDIIKDFFSPKNEYTAAPRGFSKTTILQTCCMFAIVNRMDRFIVIIEKTFTEASEVIKGIHDEFIDNERILAVYGQLVNKNYDAIKRIEAAKNPEAKGDISINGIRVRGKGFNKTIRGLKTRSWRPTRIVLDDIEEDEHINNPDQRKKYEDNYNKGIQPAVDIDGTIKMFGTILHVDSLLNNNIINHGGKIWRAHEGDDPATAPAESFLWPERWSRERLIAKRNDMMSSGQSSSAYSQEYLNNPMATEDRKFKYPWLYEMIDKPDGTGQYKVPAKRITMAEFEKLRMKKTMNGYAMIDTADTTKDKADWTAVIVLFVDPQGNRYRVDCRREKRNILGVIQLIFEIWETWSPKGLIKIGIEKKGFEDQILPLFEEEKTRRMIYPVIEELKPGMRNKEGRILGALQGFYETGKMISVGRIGEDGIFRAVGNTFDLLDELWDFPGAKHDDLSDAEAYQADILIVPMADEEKTQQHHVPEDDPWKDDKPVAANNSIESFFAGGNFVGNHSDPDPFD